MNRQETTPMSRTLAAAFYAAAALTAVQALPAPACAQVMTSEAAPSRTIFVPVDKSMAFRLDQPATKIVVAQTDIAEVVATTDRSFYVRGVAVGSTNLLVYGPGGRLQQVIDVRIGYDAQALEADMAAAFPGEGIGVRTVGEGLMLTGNVTTASVATRAKALADRFAPNSATSAMTVRASQEVVLEVRIIEASRAALQDLGFGGTLTDGKSVLSWGSGLVGVTPPNGVLSLRGRIGNLTLDATLEALEERGILRTLAKPNLVALSGEKASFLAGGEFPYPVPTGLNQITLEFRSYGVKLNFQPLVQDNGLIRLQVNPEVSQLDMANSIKIAGVTVPGLITRRADTTVELRDGESLAIGGLFQRDYANTVRQFPFLGEIPIVGTLFRSVRWKRNETELVIIVTPKLANAHDFASAAKITSLGGPEPIAADLIFDGHALDKALARDRGARK
jgi:pilus assembly protein CpaC